MCVSAQDKRFLVLLCVYVSAEHRFASVRGQSALDHLPHAFV